MSRILKRRTVEYVTVYRLDFDRVGEPGSGWTFDCDELGLIDEDALTPLKLERLQACRAGECMGAKVEPGRLVSYEAKHVEPGIILCDCGAHVDNHGGFTVTCHRCDADYNGAGQRLAPREQWGEETGEHWSECYSGDLGDE